MAKERIDKHKRGYVYNDKVERPINEFFFKGNKIRLSI